MDDIHVGRTLSAGEDASKEALLGEWIAWVDESGEFGRQAESLVGGVLVDTDGPEIEVAELKKRLLSCFPLASWPLHSTELRQPLTHVALAISAQQHGSAAPPLLAEAAKTLASLDTAPCRAFHSHVAAGNRPTKELADAAWGSLSAVDGALFSKLSEYRDRCFLNAKLVTGALNASLGFRVSVLAAAVPPAGSYETAFRQVVTRALQIVRRQGGPQDTLRLTVAERGQQFDQDSLQQWAAAASCAFAPFAAAPSPDVEIVIDLPKAMNSATNPWLVLADFVCNRLFGPLQSQRLGWDELENLTRDRLTLEATRVPRCVPRRMPTIDRAEGLPQSRWDTEQRQAWADIGRSLT